MIGHVKKEALGHLCRVLKPNGKCVFTVREHWWNQDSWDEYINSLSFNILEKSKIQYLDNVTALLVTLQKI